MGAMVPHRRLAAEAGAGVGVTQAALAIRADEARYVGDRKKKVTNFFFHARAIT